MTALVSILALAVGLASAETDPYYGWMHPPRDGSAAMNAAINKALQDGLRDVNRNPPKTCSEAALAMTAPLSATAAWFWAGSVRFWRVDRSPRTRHEYQDRYSAESAYRYASLLPFGRFVPFDPTVRVGPVLFGTDKLGHFFTNGARYYQRFLAAKKAGATDEEAERRAILLGVDEENGMLGMAVSGIFSYADLETNYRGLEFYRGACDAGGLSRGADGKWTLAEPFDIARFVDPCWDEGFYASGFRAPAPIKRAVSEMCSELHTRATERRRARYSTDRCAAENLAFLAGLAREKRIPPQLSLDDMCPRPGDVAGTSGSEEPEEPAAR